MLPCDKDTLAESRGILKEKIKYMVKQESIDLEIAGKKRAYRIVFSKKSPDARVTITEAGKTIADNELTREAIKARADKNRR